MKYVTALAVLTLTANVTLADQPTMPTPNVKHGKSLYVQVGCYACHGLAGQGAQSTGPRLSRTTLPFDAFLMQIRHPLRQMPPYEARVLSDQDAADIFAYVLQMSAVRDPKKIDLLKP